MTYLWLKAGHIIFVIFWMAGLFMLPRYFVYHQEAPEGSAEDARWVDRERKLLKIILLPSIIVVWVLRHRAGLRDRRLWTSRGSTPSCSSCCCCPAIMAGWSAMPRSWPAASARSTASSCACSTKFPAWPRRLIVVLVVVKPF